MKNATAVLIACGLAAGVAHADIIVYNMKATIGLVGGPDIGLLDGAQFSMTTLYDDSGAYIDRFGLPTVDGTGTVEISGSGNGANNTIVPFTTNTGWYPTFAGNFSSPDGLHLTFFTGDGQFYTIYGNTTPTPGAADAFIGGAIELDDFAPGGTYVNGEGLTSFFSGTSSYSLYNIQITADYIPAPGALALLGVAGLGATRRRR